MTNTAELAALDEESLRIIIRIANETLGVMREQEELVQKAYDKRYAELHEVKQSLDETLKMVAVHENYIAILTRIADSKKGKQHEERQASLK